MSLLPPEVLDILQFFSDGLRLLDLSEEAKLIIFIVWHHGLVEEREMALRRRLHLLKRFFQLIAKNGYAMLVDIGSAGLSDGVFASGKELIPRLSDGIIKLA